MPVVSVPEPTFDFGRVLAGKQIKAVFEVQNVGDAPLNISGVRTSCGCTTALMDQPIVAPGDSARIKATFKTKGRIGNQTKVISFNTNDPNNNKMELRLTGLVQPRLKTEPNEVYFNGSTGKRLSFLVNNYTNPKFKIKSVSASSKYIEVTPQVPLGTVSKLQRFTLELKEGYPHDKIHEKVALFTNDPLQSVIWIPVWGRNR